MYDIFYIGKNLEDWKTIKSNFPMASRAESLQEIQKKSLTKMFWVVWENLNINESFNFDHTIPEWDQAYVHVFKNGNNFDGISLIPKNKSLSSREIEYRFFTDKKEIDILASIPKPYDRFYISTYEEYLTAIENSSTDMFWCIWDDIIVDDSFDFSYHPPYHEQRVTHVFRNGEYFDGICLFSKNRKISKKEFNYRFFTDKKEVDVQASKPKSYDRFYISTYEEYLTAIEQSSTNMFWCIWNDVVLEEEFKFDFQIPYYEQHITHVFRNGEYFDGICLFSKNKILGSREFSYRFFTEKKEIDIQVSKPKPYDIVFISYEEPNADENYSKLTEKFPRAKRVHGIKGIHNAHIEAAKLSETEMFWVVDGDAVIVEDFKFNYKVPRYNYDCVHIWTSQNPVNGLTYGYGGVKLLPKEMTINMDKTAPDMTTSISKDIKVMSEISNITAFNTDPFNTWKSAFRESAKLSSRSIKGQVDKETEERLQIWISIGENMPHGKYAICGAISGKEFAETEPENIAKINDFVWLKKKFEEDLR